MSAPHGLVVVGLDDSPAALEALAFALDEGVAHGWAVEVVTAWLWSSSYDGMDEVGTIAQGQHAATAFQDEVLREALDARSDRPLISRTVVHDDAGRALVERAEGADLLVVGSGRKGAVMRTVLGSVSEYCVRHAPAPVVVVALPETLAHSGRQGQVAAT